MTLLIQTRGWSVYGWRSLAIAIEMATQCNSSDSSERCLLNRGRLVAFGVGCCNCGVAIRAFMYVQAVQGTRAHNFQGPTETTIKLLT